MENKEPYSIRILKNIYTTYGNGISYNIVDFLSEMYREMILDKEFIDSTPKGLTVGEYVLIRIREIMSDLRETKMAVFSQQAFQIGTTITGELKSFDNTPIINAQITKEGYEYISIIERNENAIQFRKNQMELQKRMNYATYILAAGTISLVLIELWKIYHEQHHQFSCIFH